MGIVPNDWQDPPFMTIVTPATAIPHAGRLQPAINYKKPKNVN